mmetsp:Transcript_3458/g.8566  ORF Transcript_3458/g.8566 Transcript_3458/m.8566 type:complete len:222 (-) Transcript_3458:292-957(-)
MWRRVLRNRGATFGHATLCGGGACGLRRRGRGSQCVHGHRLRSRAFTSTRTPLEPDGRGRRLHGYFASGGTAHGRLVCSPTPHLVRCTAYTQCQLESVADQVDGTLMSKRLQLDAVDCIKDVSHLQRFRRKPVGRHITDYLLPPNQCRQPESKALVGDLAGKCHRKWQQVAKVLGHGRNALANVVAPLRDQDVPRGSCCGRRLLGPHPADPSFDPLYAKHN